MNEKIFQEIVSLIKPEEFLSPVNQSNDSYFPDFIEEKFKTYFDVCSRDLFETINKNVKFDSPDKNIIRRKIQSLSESILKTVNLYYEGKIYESTKEFNEGLDKLLFEEISKFTNIDIGRNFYRARKPGSNPFTNFTKEDLFHVRYESRHIVSANRYSVPGFPSLYLGDNCYVCWEELNRHKLRDLWFARLTNKKKLKIIAIERIEDFLLDLNGINVDWKVALLLRYLVTYPLVLSCTVRVKHQDGGFKPEYIIPQLLLQYVANNNVVDGIKFPSTKVNYTKIKGLAPYNYVFPTKEISGKGFCNKLADTFHCTEPTSIELEELICNSKYQSGIWSGGKSGGIEQIELINGEQTFYADTSFGRIEDSLNRKTTGKVVW